MKRFYHGKQHHPLRSLALSLALFLAIALTFCWGLTSLSQRTSVEERRSLESAIQRGVTQCYAIEGRYPDSLEYLREEYGVQYDEERFFVDYQPLGANLLPEITILER